MDVVISHPLRLRQQLRPPRLLRFQPRRGLPLAARRPLARGRRRHANPRAVAAAVVVAAAAAAVAVALLGALPC